jgi:hypothetical protein
MFQLHWNFQNYVKIFSLALKLSKFHKNCFTLTEICKLRQKSFHFHWNYQIVTIFLSQFHKNCFTFIEILKFHKNCFTSIETFNVTQTSFCFHWNFQSLTKIVSFSLKLLMFLENRSIFTETFKLSQCSFQGFMESVQLAMKLQSFTKIVPSSLKLALKHIETYWNFHWNLLKLSLKLIETFIETYWNFHWNFQESHSLFLYMWHFWILLEYPPEVRHNRVKRNAEKEGRRERRLVRFGRKIAEKVIKMLSTNLNSEK